MLLKTQLKYFQKHNKNSKIQIERDWYQKNIYIYIYLFIGRSQGCFILYVHNFFSELLLELGCIMIRILYRHIVVGFF